MRRIVLWPVWFYGIFIHHLINGTIFWRRELLNKNVPFYSLYNFFPKHVSFKEEFGEII
jgi:hypothetical protein